MRPLSKNEESYVEMGLVVVVGERREAIWRSGGVRIAGEVRKFFFDDGIDRPYVFAVFGERRKSVVIFGV